MQKIKPADMPAVSNNDPFTVFGSSLVSESGSVSVNTTDGDWGALDVFTSNVNRAPNGLYFPTSTRVSGKGAPAQDLRVMTRTSTGTVSHRHSPTKKFVA